MEDEFIILILENDRFKVDKKRLISKSRYFQCIYSTNFNDSQKKEHVINYDITSSTLQNFIEWVHDNEHVIVEDSYSTKASIKKYEKDNFVDLLNLLQLSVLFVVDDLISNITDIIVLYWLHSEQVIDVWLMAQELGMNILQDICFAVCLDRFTDLPISSLIKLPIKNLKQLLYNINVRSTAMYKNHVASKWQNHNTDCPKIDIDNLNISKTEKRKIVHYMVGYKTEISGNRTGYISFWDGIQLSTLTELKSTKRFGKEIVGMQVIGKGFSIYIVGGEYGLGTGQFNMIIWRYCLISKKWYYFARLPTPRRHMVVAFLNNLLIMAGGVGRHRVKLSSVDTLDIHTGKWGKIQDVPECFTEVPPHCVMNKKLFFLKSKMYIFCPDLHSWTTAWSCGDDMLMESMGFTLPGIFIFKLGTNNNRVWPKISCTQKRICNACFKLYEHVPVDTMDFPKLYLHSDTLAIQIIKKPCDLCDYQCSKLDNETKNDNQELTLVPNIGSCYTIDPKTLYN